MEDADILPIRVFFSSQPTLSKEEIRAQKLAKHGKVDQALNVYEHLKTQSPRVLNTMDHLYADKKGDYTSAIKYYKGAMTLEEKVINSVFYKENISLFFL